MLCIACSTALVAAVVFNFNADTDFCVVMSDVVMVLSSFILGLDAAEDT